MARLTVTVDLSKIKGLLGSIEDLRGNYEVPLSRALLVVMASTDENFKQEGRPTKWIPSQRAIVEGGRTLQDTGILRASATNKGATDNEFRTTGTVGEVGTRTTYAEAHQEGTERLPKRPFFVIQEQDEQDIQEVFEDYLFERIGDPT